MGPTSTVASVGADLSTAGFRSSAQAAKLKDQRGSSEATRAAALRLIQAALQVTGTRRHDLDVLA
ncbi:MAG: hypothetical protein IT368_03470 [Candidatus Hydrogenedentes bacterium]|nr:hypothetical protein [Candidatus Hydrogenedentota bacterium]